MSDECRADLPQIMRIDPKRDFDLLTETSVAIVVVGNNIRITYCCFQNIKVNRPERVGAALVGGWRSG